MVGDWYIADFWIGPGVQEVREFKFHTLKHHDVPTQIRDAIGRSFGCDPEHVGFSHIVRVIR